MKNLQNHNSQSAEPNSSKAPKQSIPS